VILDRPPRDASWSVAGVIGSPALGAGREPLGGGERDQLRRAVRPRADLRP
jgi:hypothetical protein